MGLNPGPPKDGAGGTTAEQVDEEAKWPPATSQMPVLERSLNLVLTKKEGGSANSKMGNWRTEEDLELCDNLDIRNTFRIL